MKKIAFGFLTLMMLFGGVFLSACGERNISISVSSNEVEVYTNNLQEDEFENITVTLNDSDDGIGVQVESQNDVVSVTTPERDRNGTSASARCAHSALLSALRPDRRCSMARISSYTCFTASTPFLRDTGAAGGHSSPRTAGMCLHCRVPPL